MSLAEIGATPGGGVNRQALSDGEIEAWRRVIGWAREAGLTAATDAAGNLFIADFCDLPRQTHAPEKCRREAVKKPLIAVRAMQHCPDLALTRQHEPVEVGRDDRDFHQLVRIGK